MDEININNFTEEKECVFEGKNILSAIMELYFVIQKKTPENRQMILFGLLGKKIIKIHICHLREFEFTESLLLLFLENHQIRFML